MSKWKYLYNSKEWKQRRKRYLFENPLCVMCLSMNKRVSAKEVDHIIPHCGDHDLFWDWDNYQGLCKSCHSEKTYYESIKSKYLPSSIRPKSKDITFLIGPPCSGKTTWANAQGKKVIDLDVIKETVSKQNPYLMDDKYVPTCLAVRNRMINTIDVPVIVISTLNDARCIDDWAKKLKTKVSLMVTTQRQCLQWLKQSERPNKRGLTALIQQWFNNYKPSGKEVYIR